MSYSIIKSQTHGMKKLCKILGLNKNILNISLDRCTQAVVFEFIDTGYRSQKNIVAHVEIYKEGCDMGAFDEFIDRCVQGVNSIALTDLELFDKAAEFYQIVSSFLKKKMSIRGVFFEFKKNLSTYIKAPKNMKQIDFINQGQGLSMLPVFLSTK